MTNLVAAGAVYVQLKRTGVTTVDQINPADFFIACARNIDKSGETVSINGTQYDLNTMAFTNQ